LTKAGKTKHLFHASQVSWKQQNRKYFSLFLQNNKIFICKWKINRVWKISAPCGPITPGGPCGPATPWMPGSPWGPSMPGKKGADFK